ncbi:beta-1,3-galactosyltransferase 5-like [Acipenser ruthenus]|uniref:beta-1,3-galactosyltransferase 5-like n=1 Tax=Acipenser ruthenus TaxID=7906 RepID=UPI0027411B81|nr:beta-1,3-galactosyltransferase 5-like [Acipenser ruthenus]XP_058845988.1 beta-1,3-galactosyltransferase 5-like [Acipenser ruthenus]XP_058845995.1 beta-1,3-galactosyltransferase 5-like [Acipenser ruthenus]
MKPMVSSRCITGLVYASALTFLLFILKLFASVNYIDEYNEDHWNHRSSLFPEHSKHRAAKRRTGVDFKSLLKTNHEPPFCQKGLILLILVTSAPWHIEQRNAIRNTWAKKLGEETSSWQALFLIGQPSEMGISSDILQEHRIFGDILVGNYADSYRNLTLKVMHGLRWSVEHCEPQYILKTDDDCFVNTDRLARFLADYNVVKTGLYVGSLFAEGKRHVIRDPLSKWYVSREDYWEDEYPPYASGIGYVLSLDAATRIMKAAEHVPPVPMEDAYVGILAKEAEITVRSSARFTKHNVNWRVCNYRYLMVIHNLDIGALKSAQQNMIKARTACSETSEITRWK